MNVTYNKIDDVTGEIIISLEEKDYADKVKAQLKEISKTHPEKGFRPGHTPMALLERKYGTSVKYDIVNKEISDALYNYIEENKLDVLGNPMPVKDENVSLDEPDVTVKFRVAIAPEIPLTIDKDIHVPYYDIQVTPAMVDDQISSLERQFGEQGPVDQFEPDAIVKGVITELGADGAALESGIVQENGILYPKYFKDEEQKKLFENCKPGDAIVFNPYATAAGDVAELSSMLNISKEDAAEVKNDFEINITEIIALKPAELNQELFDKVFGKDAVHNEEEFRNRISEQIAGMLKNDSNYRFTIDAQKVLTEKVGDIKLPDEVLKEFVVSQNDNLTKENIEEEYVKIRPELLWQIIRLDLMKKLNIEVNQDDLKEVARSMARSQFAKYGIQNVPEENLDSFAQNMLDNSKTRNQIYEAAVNMKLFNALRAMVSLDEKKVSVEEFNALFKVENPEETSAE